MKPDGTVILEGSDLVSATPMVSNETGRYVVSFEMTQEGGEAFADATQGAGPGLQQPLYHHHAGWRDDLPGDSFQRNLRGSGNYRKFEFTQATATELAMQIESGALPLDLKVLEQRSISATLGDEALQNSILGGLVGLAVLMLFMIVVYRMPGLMADIALVCYITLVLFVLALF